MNRHSMQQHVSGMLLPPYIDWITYRIRLSSVLIATD